MRRTATILAVLGALAALAVLGWAWWTAPPVDEAGRLATVAASVPAGADGLLVLSQPRRAARWLGTHPQALALLRVAAPDAERALPRMRGFLAALASQADGPLAVWWHGRALAAAGKAGAASGSALQALAALEGLAVRVREGGIVAGATDPALLDQPPTTHVPDLGHGELSALASTGGRWWLIRAGRSRLDLHSGNPPELPGSTEAAMVSTPDLAVLAAPANPPDWLPHAPAVVVAEDGGWALALPTTPFPQELQRLLHLGGDAPEQAPPGARHWRGLLGDLWVLPGGGVAISSRPELLAQLQRPGIGEESGLVRGPELARACASVALAADDVPGGAALSQALSRAVPVLAALRMMRWRLRPDGGRILLEW